MRHVSLALTLPLVLLLGCKSSAGASAGVLPTAAPAAEAPRPASYVGKKLPTPANISPEVRASLKRTMREHGDDLTVLLWSILFLDLNSASEYAKAIADRPPMTRAEGEELARIPPRILNLGNQLHEQAMKMAELSKHPEHDSEAFAQAFGELTQTCVRCHAAYLYEKQPEQAEPAPAP